MKHFENLTPDELTQLETAIPQIAVLIAGADGKIDVKETHWAEKVTEIRGFAGESWLNDFYDQVHANFAIKFRDMVVNLPENVSARQEMLSKEIERVNNILLKLDEKVAYKLYKSYLTYAVRVAQSSGGVMGFGAVSNDEKKWVELPMITPVQEPEEEA